MMTKEQVTVQESSTFRAQAPVKLMGHPATIAAERRQQASAPQREELLTEQERKAILDAWMKKAERQERRGESMTSRSFSHQPDREICAAQFSNYPGQTWVGDYGFVDKPNAKGEIYTFHTKAEYVYDSATGKFLGKRPHDDPANKSHTAELEGDALLKKIRDCLKSES
jgi:hypothetical protein